MVRFGKNVRLLALVAAFLPTMSWAEQSGPFVLVADGQAKAVIVTADDPPATTSEAAEALQAFVRRMSGAELPIHTESKFDGRTGAVLVGMSGPARRMGVEVKQDRESGDHYVIRTSPRRLALVGNDHLHLRGSVYAVYDLLQRLGCGWYGPDPVWQVVPRRITLSIGPISVSARPDFLMRHVWMVKDRAVNDAWRLGGIDVPMNHNLERIVPPEKYRDEHPDWFGPGQPCLTHTAVRRVIVKRFREQIDKRKRKVNLSLSTNDNDQFCQCENCRTAGNVGARMVLFANDIARGLNETHRGRFTLTFLAYWVTHDYPRPMVEAEPEVQIVMVNEGDHVQPWEKPESEAIAKGTGRNNTREVRDFAGWKKTGGLCGIYEWWIPGCSNPNWRSVPWYSGETALKNLRCWKDGGIRYVTYETQYEKGNGFPIRWPLYYMAARGLWDTSVSAEDVMREACDRLYGPASESMMRFYHLLEVAMVDTDEKNHGTNWHLPSPELIYSPQVEKEGAGLIRTAAGATDDPAILARIGQERRMWNQARQTMAALRKSRGDPAFVVVLGETRRHWLEFRIDEQTIRDLHDLKPAAALFAVEPHAGMRPVQPGEIFDLRMNVRFTTGL